MGVAVDEAGVTYLPRQSISWSPAAGRRASGDSLRGRPTFSMAAIRPSSTTMSTGLIGGAPVPSMMVAPRSTSRRCGPTPRSREVAGVTAGMPEAFSLRMRSSPTWPMESSWGAVMALVSRRGEGVTRRRCRRASGEGGQGGRSTSPILAPAARQATPKLAEDQGGSPMVAPTER